MTKEARNHNDKGLLPGYYPQISQILADWCFFVFICAYLRNLRIHIVFLYQSKVLSNLTARFLI